MMSSTGNKGRFSDRIKKIRINRLRKKRKDTLEDSEIMYKNFLKVVSVIPLIVVDNIFDIPDDNKSIIIDGKRYTKDDTNNADNTNVYIHDDKKYYLQKKKLNREKVENIDVSLIKKKQNAYIKSVKTQANYTFKDTTENTNTSYVGIGSNVKLNESSVDNANTNNNHAKELEKKIINLIKKDLTKIVNELEIYESELYILSEVNNDEKTLVKCRENLAQVRKILAKIEELKEKYDYLKDNFDFEYLLEANNDQLIDRVIELRNMFSNNEVRATVEDYKLLEVYKYLYLKIDEIHDNTYKIEEEKKKQEEELKERDINFNKLKENVYNVNRVKESYQQFIEQQNQLLKDLSEKISKINSYESVNYQMSGYGKYLLNSFKYLGFLMLSPLRGIVPSIATQTVIARDTISNLRKNIKWEEHRKMVYEADDFSDTINVAINDLNLTDRMVDATLDDLIKLKMEYNDQFKKYQGDFLEYKEVINKINNMQEKMIGNKIKIEIMKNRMKQYKKENENKLKLVKRLNDQENNKAS